MTEMMTLQIRAAQNGISLEHMENGELIVLHGEDMGCDDNRNHLVDDVLQHVSVLLYKLVEKKHGQTSPHNHELLCERIVPKEKNGELFNIILRD